MIEKEKLRQQLFERAEELSILSFEKAKETKKQLNWCKLALYSLQVLSQMLKDAETEKIQERIEVLENVVRNQNR